jgi:hypothetical protein
MNNPIYFTALSESGDCLSRTLPDIQTAIELMEILSSIGWDAFIY